MISMKNQSINAALKENKDREKLLEKNINRHPTRAAITEKRRNDISVFRRLVLFQLSADNLKKKTMDIFNQLGINVIKDQFGDPHRIIGSWEGRDQNLLNVQTVCVPVHDSTSLLLFACARPESAEKSQLYNNDLYNNDSPSEIDIEEDRLYSNFLSALNVALHAENVSNSVRMTVIDDVEMLAIRTLQGLPCTVFLTTDMAIFTDPATGRAFCLFKDQARAKIVFQTTKNRFFEIATESNIALVSNVRFDFTGSKGILMDWLPPASNKDYQWLHKLLSFILTAVIWAVIYFKHIVPNVFLAIILAYAASAVVALTTELIIKSIKAKK
jgi:hypothetical protein